MSMYEELLLEMTDIQTPFQKSSPMVQLLTLLTFNTMLFVANGLLQKYFMIDMLPTLGAMTGVAPIEGAPANHPPPRAAPAAAAGPPPPPRFPAFMPMPN